MSEWSVASAPAQAQVGGSGGAGEAGSEAAFVLTLTRRRMHSAMTAHSGGGRALGGSGEHAATPTPLAGAGSGGLAADENALLFRREDDGLNQGPAGGEGSDSLVDERCTVPQVSRGPQ